MIFLNISAAERLTVMRIYLELDTLVVSILEKGIEKTDFMIKEGADG